MKKIKKYSAGGSINKIGSVMQAAAPLGMLAGPVGPIVSGAMAGVGTLMSAINFRENRGVLNGSPGSYATGGPVDPIDPFNMGHFKTNTIPYKTGEVYKPSIQEQMRMNIAARNAEIQQNRSNWNDARANDRARADYNREQMLEKRDAALEERRRMIEANTAARQQQMQQNRENFQKKVRGYATGGDMQLSSNAFQVNGNPQVTDGNQYQMQGQQVALDHNEVVSEMPQGKFVFSDKLKDPQAKQKFSVMAAKIEKSTGKAEKKLMTNRYDPAAKATIAQNKLLLQEVAHRQETLAQKLGLRNRPQDQGQAQGQVPGYWGGGLYQTDPVAPDTLMPSRLMQQYGSAGAQQAVPTPQINTQGQSGYNPFSQTVPSGMLGPIGQASADRFASLSNSFNPLTTNTGSAPIGAASANAYRQAGLPLASTNWKTSDPAPVIPQGNVNAGTPTRGAGTAGTAKTAAGKPNPFQVPTFESNMNPLGLPEGLYEGPKRVEQFQKWWNQYAKDNFGGQGTLVEDNDFGNPSTSKTGAVFSKYGDKWIESLRPQPTPEVPKDYGDPGMQQFDNDVRAQYYDEEVAPGYQKQLFDLDNKERAADYDTRLAAGEITGVTDATKEDPASQDYKTPWTTGDYFKVAELIGKSIGAFGKPEVEQPIQDNTRISRQVFDPTASLQAIDRSQKNFMNSINAPTAGLRRAMQGSTLGTAMGQKNQVLSQYQQMNQQAKGQYEDRVSNQRRFNVASQGRTNEMNAQNRAAQDMVQQNFFSSLGQFGEDLNRKRYGSDLVNYMKINYPDAYKDEEFLKIAGLIKTKKDGSQ